MSSRTWLNLALVALVAGLAVLAVYEPGLEPEPEPPALTEMDPDAVSRVHIQRPDQSDIELLRREGRWRMSEPLTMPANDFRVDRLLEVLAAPSRARLGAGEADPATLGLDPPQAVLEVDGTRLEFGDTEPLAGRRYVRVGQAIHLIADSYQHNLGASAASYVHPALLGPDAEPVAIELPELSLRQENGTWRLTPEDPQIGADAINALVQAWREAQAIQVSTAVKEQEGERVIVELAGADQPLHFIVSGDEYSLIFTRPDVGVAYHLPERSARRLLHLEQPGAEAPAPDAGQ